MNSVPTAVTSDGPGPSEAGDGLADAERYGRADDTGGGRHSVGTAVREWSLHARSTLRSRLSHGRNDARNDSRNSLAGLWASDVDVGRTLSPCRR